MVLGNNESGIGGIIYPWKEIVFKLEDSDVTWNKNSGSSRWIHESSWQALKAPAKAAMALWFKEVMYVQNQVVNVE